MQEKATLYGVGVGTGDPELLTLKAARLIRQAPVVAYLVNHQGYSQAKDIARLAFEGALPEQRLLPVVMPMELDRKAANLAYQQAASAIAAELDVGHDVVFLCEGDPLFFGSFAYLLERLQPRYTCQVVPGISTIHTVSAALCAPLTRLRESLAVISGRHEDTFIRQVLEQHDSVVIMKVAGHRQRIKQLLQETGRMQDARYLEYLGRENERIVVDVATLDEQTSVYFSVLLVSRRD